LKKTVEEGIMIKKRSKSAVAAVLAVMMVMHMHLL